MIHEQVLKFDKRADGRGIDELRPLFAQAGGVSPILHGSGIFYRGGTHILSVLTLGGPKDAQVIEGMEEKEEAKRFMHHYNFPPYSTGETGRMGGTNRRMIGHGDLAEKALFPMIPKQKYFSLHDKIGFRSNVFKWFNFDGLGLWFDSCTYGWRSSD